ncbi:glycosyltransferase [Pseudomonas putida]|uniref:glycosyltransferase n=1 Tax=Pseudomonas putida TaxID=303 RepID=UPI0018D7888A|nr:glycosyltransferase [Pseudomonas putida]MBH3415862.1 glycosyltransferase [Pseudomonas putida]MDG9814552.1 glycosyltransferase [Pseudomonas putida]
MSTTDSRPPRYEHFDPLWYLQEYPDVAAANIDPLEHFKLHGQLEGRLPHKLKALEIEKKLLYGFSDRAIIELLSIFNDHESSPYERSYASWAVARWHIANSRWKDSVPYLEYAHASKESAYDSLIVTTCLIEAYSCIGRQNEAYQCLQSALVKFAHHPDLYLCAANTLRSGSIATASKSRLQVLNSIFSKQHLSKLNIIDISAPLSLDNLQSITATPKSIDGPRVTVIVPAYNASQHIGSTLNGLINQTWSNLEIIVVDDCSSDTTCNIVQTFGHLDSRIKLYKQDCNYGAYAARNLALRYATGEYVTNHDSDDWSHPQRIQIQVQYLMQTAQVGVMTSWARVGDDLYFSRWRTDVNLVHVSVSTLMVKRSVFSEIGSWDFSRVGADSEFLTRIRSVYGENSVGSIHPDAPLVLARILPASLTNNPITHLHSQYGGVRKIYRVVADRWIHRIKARNFTQHTDRVSENFKVPRALRHHLTKSEGYEFIFFADFSTSPQTPKLLTLFKSLFLHGVSIGIFHWPNYVDSSSFEMDQGYIDHVLDGILSLVSPTESLVTDHLMVLTPSVLFTSPDRIPHVRFQKARIVDAQQLKIEYLLEHRSPSADTNLLHASSFFSSDWYLSTYPDVAEAGVDAALHYIANGAAEGRGPGPEFDSLRYLSYFPKFTQFSIPPLLHYLRIGKGLGLDPSYPIFDGIPLIDGQPTILLCGHASNCELFGAELSLIDILDAYAENSINVVVTIPSSVNEYYIETLRQKSHMVHVIPCELWSVQRQPCRYAIDKFLAVINKYSISAIHVNTIMLREPLIAARNSNVIGITHVRESLSHDSALCEQIGLTPDEIIREVHALSDKLITNSTFTHEFYFKPGSTYLIKNSFNADRFDFPNYVNRQSISIALISSNLPKKGIYDFIQIARNLETSTPNARFLLIGPENQDVISLRNDKSILPKNLTIAGYSKTPEDAVRQANIVVSLSHFEETFGRTVLESMAAGRPVVAYSHGAINELISDGQNGYLVSVRDFNAAAESLKRLCEAPDLIVSMGLSGRARAREHYSTQKMADGLSRIFEEFPDLACGD